MKGPHTTPVFTANLTDFARLQRYAAFNSGNNNVASSTEAPTQPDPGPSSVALGTGHHKGGMVMTPQRMSSGAELSWPVDSMKDMHLSGREPTMLPGILTESHRSSVFRQNEEA